MRVLRPTRTPSSAIAGLARAHARLAGARRRAGAARTAVLELLAREGQCLVAAQEIVGLRGR
ncbi:hypothetical protein [Candidatus Solirubrobacter pratensis]|uniref:hypothetical protein n=1 Tax=Candidatus Solirubrobacter pratensis TaxID=1298857 RepID=UPI001E353854|nr:hypothetical protein [Candidatus Solirubrobacter pratensis]